ncbi:hydroxyacid dehydrogenase [Nonlabens spongiae]|uniref:Hydroxyacid dehydrogenase n=1 Tax=Nonlabens spongiae TaxID=331648 RepID=A0A1W6MK99_9FLAO|nr:2-hydroxyacid dehydrogenase [Nonlabens spongiae]ARN77899.1 hydroxyacid dehydrogenase [Nonlabens spongiae]
MRVLHLDSNHAILAQKLEEAGFENKFDFESPKEQIEQKIDDYDGLTIRSRFPLDRNFLEKAKNLKFIGRVGAGLENIDLEAAEKIGIACYNAPEGNRNAVGEHALGMLLSLFNKLNSADREVKNGFWRREENRGIELEGKTVGLIGYGNMGKSFARKLSGFDCEVIFHDIRDGLQDEHAKQVSLEQLQDKSDVISLHTPQTPDTIGMINTDFINKCSKPFFLVNTARGKSVLTQDLVMALETEKVLGAALDVLEFEKSSFESFFQFESGENTLPEAFKKLVAMNHVILSPHVAGWTVESKYKLAETIASKIIKNHKPKS